MTREIKFRAWDKTEKKMSFLDYIWNDNWYNEKSQATLQNNNQDIGAKSQHGEIEIQQFTGLKDSGDIADIYEGDIIDAEGKIKGNIYESPQIYKEGVDYIIEKMGTRAWRESESIAMGRGCKYSDNTTS